MDDDPVKPITDYPEKVSIFQTLKHAGENFFENKKLLNETRERCDVICKQYHNEFSAVSPANKNKSVDDILFQRLDIKKPKDNEYEKRRICTAEELKLIQKACTDDENANIENIKYSLGFLADGYSSNFKKPCVAVVGQTKAGKSSLINCILQERVVPQKVMRQTARVTYVTHCPTKFVAHMQNGILIKINLGTDVTDEDVDLKSQDRNRRQEINVEIRVGTPNPIVQNGFDIVDSPGLNENPALNELCEKMEKSLLPLLIYVIEGRNGLTQTDVDDIQQIRKRTPELKILYYVTKLQRSKYDRLMYLNKKRKKGYNDDQDMPRESDKEVANRRLENVLNKLKREAFLPPSVTIMGSRDFHGADIWAVNEMRIHNCNAELTESDEYNKSLISHFEESLMIYLKDNLEDPLKEEIQYIQSSLEKVLEKATSIASEITSERREKHTSLEQFQKSENKLYEKELGFIVETLKREIDKMIDDNKRKFIEIIKDMTYRTSERMDQKAANRMGQYNNLLKSRRNEIRETIENSLNEEIKSFITRFMEHRENQLRKKLRKIVIKLSEGKFGCSSFEIMLKNRLFYEYEFYEECSMGESDEFSYNSKSKRKIDKLVKSFGNLTCGLFKTKSNLDMEETNPQDHSQSDDPRWKEEIAEKVLDEFNRPKFLDNICKLVTEEFKSRHENFAKELDEQGKFLQDNLNIGEEEKKIVRAFAEKMAVQFAITLHVRTPLYVMIDPRKPKQRLDQGGQGFIEKAHIIDHEDPIVIKHYNQKFKDFYTSEKLLTIAMEIYYSSRLNHPCFLKLVGIHFQKTGEEYKFHAYYPYLPHGCMKKFLKARGNQINIESRLKFSIDIAKGLQFLHKLQIIHRDINLKNVLVRDSKHKQYKFEAVIADYGLAKSFGFIGKSHRVGTPLYIAPELFNEKHLERESYDYSIDVFSFGISLWQLMSYKLDADCQSCYPKFVMDCEYNANTIEKMVLDNNRPEDKAQIPPELTALMKRCWLAKPGKRPSFFKVMNDVLINCDENDSMKQKTILDELERIKTVLFPTKQEG